MSDEPELDFHELHDTVLREASDPVEGTEPAPLWMWLGAALTVAFAGYYLGAFSGGFSVDRMDLAPSVAAPGEVQSGPPTYEDRDPLELGKERFTRCVSCHGAEGRGLPGRYPPLAESEWVTSDPEVVVRILLHGLGGPIEVSGKPYLGTMPKWGFWTDAEIAGVLTYVRSNFGNQAPAIDFEKVRAIRATTKTQDKPWTSAELQELGGPR